MSDNRKDSLDQDQLRRRQALAKLGLAAAAVYAVPVVASVKVYAHSTISPSKHSATSRPGIPTAHGGAPGAPKGR